VNKRSREGGGERERREERERKMISLENQR